MEIEWNKMLFCSLNFIHLIYQTGWGPREILICESMIAEGVWWNLLFHLSRKLSEFLLFSFPFSWNPAIPHNASSPRQTMKLLIIPLVTIKPKDFFLLWAVSMFQGMCNPSVSSDPGAETSLSVPYTAVLSSLYALSSGPLRSKKAW